MLSPRGKFRGKENQEKDDDVIPIRREGKEKKAVFLGSEDECISQSSLPLWVVNGTDRSPVERRLTVDSIRR